MDDDDEEEEEQEELMSEVHVGCPPNFSGPFISHFTFPFPYSKGRQDDQLQGEASPIPNLTLDDDSDLPEPCQNIASLAHNRTKDIDQLHAEECTSPKLSLDEDGDLVLTRQSKNYQRNPIYALTIQHNITSSLPSVGLQVWMAALVLTDFVLHKSFTSSNFDGVIALELGSGTGLVGIALGLFARKVFVTDRGSNILDNCATNVSLNSSLLIFHGASVCVKELDWKEEWPPRVQAHSSQSPRGRYSWTSSEVEEAKGASVLLAADVIYSDELTDSFFDILEKLMSRGSHKVLYLALEKRYNFSMNDLDVVANGYAHFRSFLKDEEECILLDHLSPCFKGEMIDLKEIPQYIREYERGQDVELWKITYCSKK